MSLFDLICVQHVFQIVYNFANPLLFCDIIICANRQRNNIKAIWAYHDNEYVCTIIPDAKKGNSKSYKKYKKGILLLG